MKFNHMNPQQTGAGTYNPMIELLQEMNHKLEMILDILREEGLAGRRRPPQRRDHRAEDKATRIRVHSPSILGPPRFP